MSTVWYLLWHKKEKTKQYVEKKLLIIIQFIRNCFSLTWLCYFYKHLQTLVVVIAFSKEGGAFFFVSFFLCEPTECVCLLRRWVFHAQFSRFLASRPLLLSFSAAHCHRRENESKLRSAHSFISSTRLCLTRHWSLREHFVHVISVTAASLCLV